MYVFEILYLRIMRKKKEYSDELRETVTQLFLVFCPWKNDVMCLLECKVGALLSFADVDLEISSFLKGVLLFSLVRCGMSENKILYICMTISCFQKSIFKDLTKLISWALRIFLVFFCRTDSIKFRYCLYIFCVIK